MTRMSLDEWEQKHGIEQGGAPLAHATRIGEERSMTDDFLNEAVVAGVEKVGRKRRRSEGDGGITSEMAGRHDSTRATGDTFTINDETKTIADKYIPRSGDENDKEIAPFNCEQWGKHISKSWLIVRDTAVQGIFTVGENLIAAKAALSEEDWQHLLEHGLPFGLRTVQRFIAVASDKRLRTMVQLLPPSWGTLNELTKLTDSELDQLASDGVLRPDMERSEVGRARSRLSMGTSKGASAPAREREDKPTRAKAVADIPIADIGERTLHMPVDAPSVDYRKTLQEIVTMIELSGDVPAVDTLSAIHTLAKAALDA